MTEIVIGSRESALALAQTREVYDFIRENCGDISPHILTMKTTGDKILDRKLSRIGGKGLFVKELDKALLQGKSQLSVHSAKDVPMEVKEELPILGFSKREDPRDVLVLPLGVRELDTSKPVGSSSERRRLQFKKLFPRMEVKAVRGSVETRLRKLDSGEYSALVLAAAGLKRLGLENRGEKGKTMDFCRGIFTGIHALLLWRSGPLLRLLEGDVLPRWRPTQKYRGMCLRLGDFITGKRPENSFLWNGREMCFRQKKLEGPWRRKSNYSR